MVVEDDTVNRILASAVLQKYGWTVIEAMDGGDAVKQLTETKDRIDLVMLDVIMPNKTGKEAYEEVKALKGNLKALFVSKYTPDIMEEKGFFEYGVSFLPKPTVPAVRAAKARELRDG
jgi:two-component system, cell cycle sensor histidine kinase and response regulator CckA